MKSMTCAEYQDVLIREVDHILLDVRTPLEYNSGHIENALNIPLDLLPDVAMQQLSNRNEPILIYCRSGRRAEAAAQILHGMGYSDLRILEGGYEAYCGFKA